MSPAELAPWIEVWRLRFDRRDAEIEAAAARARALLPALCRYLVERWGVRRIWLFGSLAEGGFHDRSDIDLAVEGFPPGPELFRAGAELDDLARPFRVDLVPLEGAREPVRRRIEARGELLHDAGR